MFLEILIAILLGVTAGTFTGLVPGVHVNLIAAGLLSFSVVLLTITSPLLVAVFVVAMSVTHSFVSVIPAIFLGAPESGDALGVLPGHRLLHQGQGLFAVQLTVIGSFIAVIISFVLFPFFVMVVVHGYDIIQPYIKYGIIAVVAFMILRDRYKVWAFVVFAISGLLGYVVLRNPSIENPLFPLLSGLFGIATLLYSLRGKSFFPAQKEKKNVLEIILAGKALSAGCVSGFITAVLPGLGSGMASTLASQLVRNIGDKGFMLLIGSISTFNFNLSLVTYYVIDRARNGSIITVQQILSSFGFQELGVLLITILIAGSCSVYVTLLFSRAFLSFISRVSYIKLVLSIMCCITAMAFILGGWYGLLILVVASAVGLIPAIVKTTRTMGMGCLIVPILLFFFGF
ncbi:MAG: tripartite tricarboxylate transporter permease [Candidatus Woesearchaeota archaeon]